MLNISKFISVRKVSLHAVLDIHYGQPPCHSGGASCIDDLKSGG